ncbi:hypothetical protein [Flavobacterium sp. UMI-01]|uniref:hypothetical protein n=1 Tax=Flavobacterium sp. UMI-01 TaxID=1441053 RepID=UPI001C7D4CC9|nr:hypothetical protein [Flavobacterium sp. UMI-01]GIZ08336.1 hypothetical protein FUMI01_10630 [Flavobacterium sp. UMI-01]
MGEFKGTKAPWIVGRPGTVVSDNKESITISGGVGEDAIKYYGGNLICESVSNSNAKLIAAAPEMLEMLIKVEKVLRECTQEYGLSQDVEKLIQKATE